MQLDQNLQRELAKLADSEDDAGLDAVTRQRILVRVREESAKTRSSFWSVGLTLGLGFGIAAMVMLAWSSLDQSAENVGVMARNVDKPGAAQLPEEGLVVSLPVPVAGPPCEQDEIPEPRIRYRGGEKVVEMMGRARWVLSRGAEARVETSRCRTEIELTRGEIAVHAEDLRGGQLVVRTAHGEITVLGTVFTVRTGSRMRLQVAEGQVGVSRGGEPVARVQAHEQLNLSSTGVVTQRPLGALAVRGLLDWVTGDSPRPRAVAPAPPAHIRGSVTEGTPRVHPRERPLMMRL